MKTVGIADLRARLSEHLRAVRRGKVLTVVDRNTPVAQLVPIDNPSLDIRPATRLPKDIPASPAPVAKTDSVALLLADRAER
jgi:prevent-host-death family protein